MNTIINRITSLESEMATIRKENKNFETKLKSQERDLFTVVDSIQPWLSPLLKTTNTNILPLKDWILQSPSSCVYNQNEMDTRMSVNPQRKRNHRQCKSIDSSEDDYDE